MTDEVGTPEETEEKVVSIELGEAQFAALWSIATSQQINVSLDVTPVVASMQQAIKDAGMKAGVFKTN